MAFIDRTAEHFARSKKSCVLVETATKAHALLEQVQEAALDFETTSLHPADGDIRLTTICNDEHHFIIDHMFLGTFDDYVSHFKGKRWWVYNGKFEQRWLDHYDRSESVKVYDVDFAKKAKMGGSPSKLAWMAKSDLGIIMDKEEQSSDWSRPTLTRSQLDYAGFDGYVTWKLKQKWWDEELTDDQKRGFAVFNDAVRGTIECEETGLYLDFAYHAKHNVKVWETKSETFYNCARRFTPKEVIENIGSDQQLGKFLEAELHPDVLRGWPRTPKTKRLKVSNSELRSLARQVPYPMSRWLAAVIGYRYYRKYLSTYGENLLTKQSLQGKITSRFNIAQAAPGRYSSSDTNLQNIPRKPVIRRAFYCPPLGDLVMPLADYSGIEVRVLAELSQDEQLLEDAIYGDAHAASASQIYGLDYDYIREVLKKKEHKFYYDFKEKRTKAKGFTFQLTYGAGAEALSYVLHCSFDDAIKAIQKWAERYHKAFNYRNIMFDQMMATGFLPVIDGRTIYVRKDDRTMPVAANYPIQGAASSVMYRAIHHVRERFIDHGLDAYLAVTVHDELLSYAHRDHGDEALEQLVGGMRDGWLDIFPNTSTDNLIDFKLGTCWADKP